MDDDILMSGFSSGKVEFSKPLVSMLALKDCREKRAVEMKSGYFNETLDKNQVKLKTWIPDSRKTFISSVISFKTLLSPEIKKDKLFKEVWKKIKEKEKEVFNKYAYTKKIIDNNNKIIVTKEKYIPQIDESVILQDPKSKKNVLIKGGWNKHIDNYFYDLIPVYDELFEELNNLIERMGYYKRISRGG